MNTKQIKTIKTQIEKLIANGFAETHVGFHAEYRSWDMRWQRGVYAQIAESFGDTRRIYAKSYAELLFAIQAIQQGE